MKNRVVNLYVNSRIYSVGKTGIKYYIQSLYDHFPKSSFINNVYFLQSRPNPQLGETRSLNLPTLFGTVLFDLLIVLFLARDKADLKIFHGASNMLPLIKGKKYRYVVTIHDLAFLITDKDSVIFRTYYKYILRRTLKIADVIIAVSNNTKKDIENFYGIPEDKIQVIYPGINQIYVNKKVEKRVYSDKYFLSVSTHPKRKNLNSVLEAMALNPELKDYKYVIAGLIRDEQVQELHKKIEELNLKSRVIIHGYASEKQLISLYQHAAFFIYPSFYEGFGFPVLEAMACKCPVITSNNSSLIELVPNKNFLVDPYDVKDISNKMTSIVGLSKQKRNQLIDKNLKFSKQFNWKNSRNELNELYEKLIV